MSGSRLLSGLLLLLFGGLLVYFFVSSNFYVYDAEVIGAEHLSPSEVFEVSEVNEMSVFYIRPAGVEARLEDLPWVEEAHVCCSFPNQVRITLEERQVAFVWRRGDNFCGMDREGVLLPLSQVPEDVLQVEDRDPQSVKEGPGQELIASVLAVWRYLPKVRHLAYNPTYGLVFHSPEGYPVRLGQGRIAEKAAIWQVLESELAAREIHPVYVDLRFPSSPYYKESGQ
ncbi:MAG: FtsQ-type POTRA domain-containing protein [Chloroflexota bacterium]|nr:FtsQ-type POTRA domain-containing protein [Chloroflexota bacterium]